jgi:RES domain-containing protein
VASWRARPAAIAGEWTCFRQVDPRWPALFHDTGARAPTQESGRWHREGEGYAQYMSLSPLGAWAEHARYHSIRDADLAREQRRDLWVVFVREQEIADLGSFDRFEECGLDPKIAVGDHAPAQDLADELRVEGFRGVVSPSAALPGVVNLTIFGERYEKVLHTDLAAWRNPDPEAWLPCQIAVEAGPMPIDLCTETVFMTKKHAGYRDWLTGKGRALPRNPP